MGPVPRLVQARLAPVDMLLSTVGWVVIRMGPVHRVRLEQVALRQRRPGTAVLRLALLQPVTVERVARLPRPVVLVARPSAEPVDSVVAPHSVVGLVEHPPLRAAERVELSAGRPESAGLAGRHLALAEPPLGTLAPARLEPLRLLVGSVGTLRLLPESAGPKQMQETQRAEQVETHC